MPLSAVFEVYPGRQLHLGDEREVRRVTLGDSTQGRRMASGVTTALPGKPMKYMEWRRERRVFWEEFSGVGKILETENLPI